MSYCFVLFFVTASFIAIPIINQKSADTNESQADTPNISLSYIVKDFNGNIAVFESDVEKPFKITDVNINTLPKVDQERLREGIYVTEQNELNSLLEDLCS